MKTPLRTIRCLLLFGLSLPASAFELAKPETDPYNWNLSSPTTLNDAGQPALFTNSVEGWWNQPWGTRHTISLTTLNTQTYQSSGLTNLDFKQRLLSTTGNTIVDAGIGIKTVGIGHNDSRDGLRLSLGGRMGVGDLVTLYGESAWMPGLIESNGFDELSGLEFETGVLFYPLPNMSIRAAYRRLNLDYTLSNGGDTRSLTEGIIFGTGIHW